jgi:hypothetical protein
MRCTNRGLASAVFAAIVGASVLAEDKGAVNTIRLEPPVRLKAGQTFIDTGEYTAHSGPSVTDLDANGKSDLIVGNFDGQLQVFMNVGTSTEPNYEDKGLLKVNGEAVTIPNW